MATVRELMTPAPHTIGAAQPIEEAAKRMRQLGVRHLPVLEGAQLVGVLSDRDVRLVESIAAREGIRVGEAMTAEPYVVDAGADLKDVVEKMAAKKIGSAIVTDHEKVLGIFTTTDALHLLLRHLVVDELRGF